MDADGTYLDIYRFEMTYVLCFSVSLWNMWRNLWLFLCVRGSHIPGGLWPGGPAVPPPAHSVGAAATAAPAATAERRF